MPAVKSPAKPGAFSIQGAVARKSRFTVPIWLPTSEGQAGVGLDNQESAFLVHQVGRQTEAVALHAVAVVVAGGGIPVGDLVAAFASTGKLEELERAIAASKPKPPASK